MRAVDLIRLKRDGGTLSSEQIAQFVHAAAESTWPDYQLSAMLMAIWLRGMSAEEIATLTGEMADSGDRYRWDDVPGPKVDKHSTGGVGDKTSLILGPLAAACGVIVPMMSGRGLGHTGGTLDKLESIPGFRVGLSKDELRAALLAVGIGMIGQSARVAPADRKLYALRDATATVESIPLITASILSKKLAEGIDGLVMDVKAGNGAFMKDLSTARQLAQSIVAVGTANGLPTEAMLTRMDAPLGRAIGNSLEVIECIDVLKGQGPGDLAELSIELAARMVRLAGIDSTLGAATTRVRNALASGAGLEKFRQMVVQQQGDPRVVDDYSVFAIAPNRTVIAAEKSGYVAGLHAEKLGIGCMILGAGRERAEDSVDHGVGAIVRAAIGEKVSSGDAVLEIYYRDSAKLDAAMSLLKGAISISDSAPTAESLVVETITSP